MSAHPLLYRYMDERFVTRFLNEGALRISALSRFQNYPDEIRGDTAEGAGFVSAEGPNSVRMTVATRVGADAYILCASMNDSRTLAAQFDANDCLVIVDPTEFAVALGNAIPGALAVRFGPCRYVATRTVERVVPELTGREMLNEEGRLELSARTLGAVHQKVVGDGGELLFMKHMKYHEQCEFRFVWTVDPAAYGMYEYLDITCNDAARFCRRG